MWLLKYSFNYQLVDKLNTNTEMDDVVNDIITVRRHHLNMLRLALLVFCSLCFVFVFSAESTERQRSSEYGRDLHREKRVSALVSSQEGSS